MTQLPLPEQLPRISTNDLKNHLLKLTRERDTDSLSQKVRFYQAQLEPLVTELTRRNPFPQPEDQLPLVVGVWLPVWSTIPFQDILPGRLRNQSYQIFHDNGFYANIARYAPGSKLPLLRQLSSVLLALDFMIVQTYGIANGQWQIQNVAIKQALRFRGRGLDIPRADRWFRAATPSEAAQAQGPEPEALDQAIARQSQKIYQATPQLEHLYIDQDFRVVKSQREAKQRPSYTIAVRHREKTS